MFMIAFSILQITGFYIWIPVDRVCEANWFWTFGGIGVNVSYHLPVCESMFGSPMNVSMTMFILFGTIIWNHFWRHFHINGVAFAGFSLWVHVRMHEYLYIDAVAWVISGNVFFLFTINTQCVYINLTLWWERLHCK